MTDISFSMTADEKDVTKALQNLIKENAKLRTEITAGVNEAKSAAAQEREWQKLREKASKDAVSQMQQLNAAAAKIRESVASPFELAKAKTADLRKHLQDGRITVDEYRAAYANVARELKEATRDHAAEAAAVRAAAEATKAAADAEKKHSELVKEAISVSEKHATAEEKYAAKVARLNMLKAQGVLTSKDHARAIEAEKQKLAGVGEASDKSGGLIGGLTGKMAGFVGGLASASAVIGVLKAEYDALLERQGKSKDAHISLATEQEALISNLGGADAGQVTGQIRDLSRTSGIKEADLTRAVNESMSARGDLAVDDVMKAVGTAAKVRKFAPSELSGLAAATVDTQKQTGLGTDESLGFLMQLQSQARTSSLKGSAENLTPAVGGIMNLGADRQTAGALLASLSQGMGDRTGAQSATSGISLAKQLREFGQQNDPAFMAKTKALKEQQQAEATALSADFDKQGIAIGSKKTSAANKAEMRRQLKEEEDEKRRLMTETHKEQTAKLSGHGGAVDIGAMIQQLQRNPELRQQFLGGASFEAKALPAVESLLSGGTQAGQFAAAKDVFNQSPKAALDNAIAQRGGLESMRLAESNLIQENVTDQQKLGDVTGAQSAVNRGNLSEFRKSIGRSATGTKVQGFIEDVVTGGGMSAEQNIAAMEREIADLKSGKTDATRLARSNVGAVGLVANLGGASLVESRNASNPETIKQVKALEAILATAKQQLEQNQKGQHAGVVQNRRNNQIEGGP